MWPPELPPELMADILCRLPVKSLLQIRCVSKPWCRFIDSPFFIRTHLNRSIQLRKNQFFILSNTRSEVVKSIDLEFLETTIDLQNPLKCKPVLQFLRRFARRGGQFIPRFRSLPDHLQIIVPRWERPHFPQLVQVRVWGTCNGLVLMSGRFSTCLWNPSTRKHRSLPELPVPSSSFFYGFGYDSASDDYKVIKIMMCKNLYQVWVYSLQSNSWRESRNTFPPNMKCEGVPGVLVCEALHWSVKVKSESDDAENDFILKFDLNTEEYRMFPQPKCQNAEFHSRVGAFNGSSLCLIYSYFPVGFEIWVMEEDSWTRVTLQRGDLISYPGGFISVNLRDGKEVMLHRNFYETNTQKEAIFHEIRDKNSDLCLVSLISPDGGAAIAQPNEALSE